MSMLESRREVARLAGALHVEERELAYLRDQPAEALRTLRVGLSEHLFERHRRTFRRIGKLAGSVPAPLAGRIAQAALGPAVSARAAATMEPPLAVKLSSSLPAGFLAELSVQLDPERARPIIAGLPERTILDVSAILLERGEHLAMSRFIPVISADLAVRVIEQAERRVILAIANLAEDNAAVEQILERLPVADDAHLAAAVTDEEVALDALSLAARVSPANGARVLRAGLDRPDVAGLVAGAITTYGLADELKQALDELSDDERSALGA
ncbi:hypothetical protein [Nocardioides daejeonensis]|uniref:hypothetical protein n=1 Tax=Nocardioides daejeonensis TaxID=1046556 RepID=UPI0013A543F4|nr:hypothetical protein [Nocardioides daejeonensis]